MGEQHYQGTLASGGRFIADGQGIRILDPAGNQLAGFGRDVISGISRDGQVVTIERHSDTIVTLTAASITDAVGLESYVRDTVLTPPEAAPQAAPPPPPVVPVPPPPMAFDAIDEDSGAAQPGEPPTPSAAATPRPPITSRPDAVDEAGAVERPQHDLPEPVPTSRPVVPPPPAAASGPPAAPADPPTPVAEAAGASSAYVAPPPAAADETDDGKGGRRLWLWGCLGCGGLLIAAVICVAVLAATGALDDLTDDDATPTPFIIIATSDDANPTENESSSGAEPTSPTGGDATVPGAEPPPDGVLQAGESGTVDGVELTFLSSRTDAGGIIPPDEGNEYLILRFEVQNTNAEEVTISTLLEFELQDAAGEEFTVALFAETEGGLDTDIPAGEAVEGEVAFEVPIDSGPYIVIYESFGSNEQLRWQVS